MAHRIGLREVPKAEEKATPDLGERKKSLFEFRSFFAGKGYHDKTKSSLGS
jgi:hypothetical protein